MLLSPQGCGGGGSNINTKNINISDNITTSLYLFH